MISYSLVDDFLGCMDPADLIMISLEVVVAVAAAAAAAVIPRGNGL